MPGDANTSDRDLISACLSGDEEAWKALLERYRRLVYSIPIRYGFGQQDAADIFQDVCIVLLENLACLRDPDALSSWLITVTRRECGRYRRNGSKENPMESMDDQSHLAHAPDPHPTPDELSIQWQQQHLLRYAVEQLPVRHRQLIQYLFYESLSYEEIGERLRMPVASIGPTRARALEKLKRIMATLDASNLFGTPLNGNCLAAAPDGHGSTRTFLHADVFFPGESGSL